MLRSQYSAGLIDLVSNRELDQTSRGYGPSQRLDKRDNIHTKFNN